MRLQGREPNNKPDDECEEGTSHDAPCVNDEENSVAAHEEGREGDEEGCEHEDGIDLGGCDLLVCIRDL